METKKQKAIREAYGEYWEEVKDYVDENGKLKIHYVKLIGNLPTFFEVLDNVYVRPISLQGIETNNGWICIESESDLPSVDGDYFVNPKGVNNNKHFFIRYWLNAKKDYDGNWVFTEYPKEWLELYSHYQPIEKPKPPIY